jgi:hypothetical protein
MAQQRLRFCADRNLFHRYQASGGAAFGGANVAVDSTFQNPPKGRRITGGLCAFETTKETGLYLVTRNNHGEFNARTSN